MSKSRRLLIGILSFLPLVLLVFYVVLFFHFFLTIFHNMQEPDVFPPMLVEHMLQIVGVAVFIGICTLALKIYFIIHAVNHTAIDSSERVVWILVFIFAGMIGYPVYWYLRIWKMPLPGA